mmetsp:Transcript_10474/g.30644  ORF Transcript_10474/g.30644 Transcript_10474/m.30644 type:complete len:519 (-) Transcript_10474:1085-2641(-)
MPSMHCHATKGSPLLGSKRFSHRLTSALVAFLPLHWSTNLSSSEALLNSAWRPRTSLAISGESLLFRYEPNENGLFRRHSTTNLALGTELSHDLARDIHQSFQEKETDGVVDLATSSSLMIHSNLDVNLDLIPAILVASEGKKGVAASIMNALIGSTCLITTSDDKIWSLMSDRTLSLMEGLQEAADIVPDIVTYSLAHQALLNDPDARDLANTVLLEAERRTKKVAGGKRRKLLASSRRKRMSSFADAEASLKELLGNEFKVLLETDDFAVVNKPSGVPCFHVKTTTAGKIKRGKGKKKGKKGPDKQQSESSDISLEDALVSCNVQLSTLNPDALGLVHRLDRGSSGCLILAKSNEMHTKLISEFFLRRTTKKYVALVQESSMSSFDDKDCSSIDHPVHGRPARSEYRLLKRFRSSDDEDCVDGAALLEFEIFTGRKHQIRVHAAEVLQSPVWRDPLYSTNGDAIVKNGRMSGDSSERIFLHASHLAIPELGIDIESPVPTWWKSTISAFGSEKMTE